VNKACGSSLRAIVNACQSILCGDNDIVLAGGAEAMSRAPFLLDGVRWGNRLGHQQVIDSMYRDGFFCPLCGKVMGETAETLAGRYGITRREQDAYAAESQQRCERARRAGHFKNELVPMNVKTPRGDIQVDRDEHPRDGVTPESLAKLPAVFKEGGTVHAGSSSGIVDGAAALIVLSNKAVEEHKARPMAITPL
jgi:acetyl-CoA C-acetyltransferase